MIIPDRAASVNPFSQTFSKTLRISMIIAKGGAHSLFILSKGQTFRRYSGSPREAKNALSQGARNGRLRRPGVPVFTGGNAAVWRRRQKGQGNLGVPAPFVSAGRPRHPRPPKAAIVHAHLERKVASSGAPLYRRNRLPSAEGKERRALVASDGENQAFFACLRSTADFTISMPIRHTTPISTMVPPGFSPP